MSRGVIIWLLVSLSPCVGLADESFARVVPDTIQFVASDSVIISAAVWATASPRAVALLLPMLGRGGASWSELILPLVTAGYAVIAPDLRDWGGGRTILSSLPLDNSKVGSGELAASVLDVQALLADLAARFPALPAVLIGAGFGANVAFNAVAVESRVRAVIMLSPGETYRDLGLRGPCDPDRIPLYVIAAGDDDYSAVSARKFAARCAGINYLEFETGGHGTYLFETHAELVDSITQFLEQELR